MPGASEPLNRMLYESEWCALGLWNCVPTNALWRQENVIGDRPVIAIPWTSVVIHRAGAENALVNPNWAVYYRAGEHYERRLVSDEGDRCAFLQPSEELIRRSLEAAGLQDRNGTFPFSIGPGTSGATRAHHRLAASIVLGRMTGRVEIESTLTEIVCALVSTTGRTIRRSPAGRAAGTRRAHRDLVDAVRMTLCKSFDEPGGVRNLGIEAIADTVHASAFHMCRVFKQEIGMTIGQYAMRLRLRSAAESVAWSRQSMTEIAQRFGFSSHAHFTSAWTSEFGSPPTALRQAIS
jgi:AraC family transcriptional regulator